MAKPRLRAPRFVVSLKVVCDTGLGVFSGVVSDMSESGAFLETDHALRPGTMVTLIPDVSDEVTLPEEIKAQVIRARLRGPAEKGPSLPGIAFRFVGLTVTQFAELRAYLSTHGRRSQAPLGKKAPPQAP